MKELIKITEQNGIQAVSARELYEFLEIKEGFNRWIERMFEYGFTENIDYQAINIFVQASNGIGGTNKKDYALSLDCAKEISMLQRSEKGKQARQYFLECEKLAKQIKPLSQLEILAQSAQILLEQDRRINQVQEQVNLIEAKLTTRPEYFTVAGYASLLRIDCGIKLASSLGRKASKLCKERGIPTEEIPDPRFGLVKTYPAHILKEIFDKPITA
ncbi:antA/AntB antirepressor family protein [Capnocytophaga catalasegens]|uniref:AntA/AntB antirepressor domain-containing protein n=1 Tax=Capnocytophaga catalasegens TaxID=1004260 RepID=A0AAV5AY95_9FLAO|nr:antA/AntB antirepressor family protein [Capnocytophaga catalasegens]GIZ15102.1 hypothetical protein RCZ03_11020 [Capnocytophaga catalasegens]GJM50013.1 hypothetical protein RCZ15_09880 [Capnocytophaga catalasegens]GJM53884.1 hypothetical protein RCZ16_22000 [Capnocytophaga catalasegens]